MNFLARAADGCRLAVEAHGPLEAPPLLFLHSIGCGRDQWRDQVAALSRDFRCIVFDSRGHGASDAPAGDYSLAQLGGDAMAVLDEAGAPQAHVCGLSLGGLVALWLATDAPHRVARLVLANTASRIGSFQSWEDRRQRVLAHGLASIADMAAARFFSDPFRRTHPERVAEIRRGLAGGSADGYAGCCAALRDADLTADLAAVRAPTLVIGGALDISTPPDQTAALADAIPIARHQVLEAAHLSNLERPDGFTAAVRAHLQAA